MIGILTGSAILENWDYLLKQIHIPYDPPNFLLEIDPAEMDTYEPEGQCKNAPSMIIYETIHMSINSMTIVEKTNTVGIFMHWNTT